MDMPPVQLNLLPYSQNLERRAIETIDLVVIHCTELPDLAMARGYGERVLYSESGTGNSGHFYIDRDGRIEQWVPLERVAHHVRGFNERSIGIELINQGRYPAWFNSTAQNMNEPYPAIQLDALKALLQPLVRQTPRLRWIAGHQQLDTDTLPSSDRPDVHVQRKLDPGPLFPWNALLDAIELTPLPIDPDPG